MFTAVFIGTEIRIEGHSGIVKCLVSLGTKVYSAG